MVRPVASPDPDASKMHSMGGHLDQTRGAHCSEMDHFLLACRERVRRRDLDSGALDEFVGGKERPLTTPKRRRDSELDACVGGKQGLKGLALRRDSSQGGLDACASEQNDGLQQKIPHLHHRGTNPGTLVSHE